MAANQTIKFYRETDEHGWFSNYYPSKFILDELEWPTAEHYFQAQKYAGTDDPKRNAMVEMVRTCKTPGEAKKLGQQNNRCTLRTDWEQVKEDVMRKTLRAKFSGNKNLKVTHKKTRN